MKQLTLFKEAPVPDGELCLYVAVDDERSAVKVGLTHDWSERRRAIESQFRMHSHGRCGIGKVRFFDSSVGDVREIERHFHKSKYASRARIHLEYYSIDRLVGQGQDIINDDSEWDGFISHVVSLIVKYGENNCIWREGDQRECLCGNPVCYKNPPSGSRSVCFCDHKAVVVCDEFGFLWSSNFSSCCGWVQGEYIEAMVSG